MGTGFVIKYQDIYNLLWAFNKKLKSQMENIESCQTAINYIISNGDFKGKSADSIKSYLDEVHLTATSCMKVISQSLLDNIALYKAGYYEVDSSTNFILDESAMNSMKSDLVGRLAEAEESEDSIYHILQSVSDLISRENPDISPVETVHDTVNKHISDTISSASALEDAMFKCLKQSSEVLIDQLGVCVSSMGTKWSMTGYESGSIYGDSNVYALMMASEIYHKQHIENSEMYDAIWKYEEDLTVKAEERKTNGIWKAVGGAALIIGGTVCIVATAGAATPVFAAGLAAGGGTIAFGLADSAEGGQEIYLGSIGDIDSVSVNLIKSVIFSGNEEAYQMTENVFAFAASALVPIGQMSTVNSLSFRTGAVAFGKIAVSDAAGNAASSYVMDKTGNRFLAMMSGMTFSTVSGAGLNTLDRKFNISGIESAAVKAQAQQGTKDYPGVDDFDDIVIKKGTVLYRGEPNGTGFFTTADAIEQNSRSADKIFKGLQVQENPVHGYRSEMGGYKFTKNFDAADGIVKANPQYGTGGLPQVYVSDIDEWIRKGYVVRVDTIPLKK